MLLHLPRSVFTRLHEIAEWAGVDLVLVCGVALRLFAELPQDQRRVLCMEYLDSDWGELALLALNRPTASLAGPDTKRGLSALQGVLTALWMFAQLPAVEAVEIVAGYAGSG